MKSDMILNKYNYETDRLIRVNYESQKEKLSNQNNEFLEKCRSTSNLKQNSMRTLKPEAQKLLQMRTLREYKTVGKNVGLLKNLPKVIDLEGLHKGRNNNIQPYFIFNDSKKGSV